MSFVRRFTSPQDPSVYLQTSGICIIDGSTPGAINGTGNGTVAIVGEFADGTYAVAVDASGSVTTSPQPVAVYGGNDLTAKGGGFDPSIGKFQDDGGNAFVALRNKKFAQLVICPVNIFSSKGVRCVRQLPTCKSLTDPTPITPVAATSVPAGTEFKSGTNQRVHVGSAAQFSGDADYLRGVDGVMANGSTAVIQPFTSAGSDFVTAGVAVGDVIGTSDAKNALTFRVQAVTDLHTLQVELLDGTTFTTATGTALPFRIHYARTADSFTAGGKSASGTGAYNLPARPLDSTVTGGTDCAPTVATAAGTATAWNPLSGLALLTMPGGDLVYTSTIQAPNCAQSSDIDALYVTALAALASNSDPARNVDLVISARHDTTVNAALCSHEQAVTSTGKSRIAVLSPGLGTKSLATVIGNTAPGVGANRDEGTIYTWPGYQTFVPEAAGVAVLGADGSSYTTGQLDTHGDAWLASIMSQLAPYYDPAQNDGPVPIVMSNVLGFSRGTPASTLDFSAYAALKAAGVCAGISDPDFGFVFQDGVTTSLVAGRTTIVRKRMAGWIEDSLASGLKIYRNKPISDMLKDSEYHSIDAFLDELKSPNNPPAQHIKDYVLDDTSPNSDALEGQGIHVILVTVRTLASQVALVLACNIGPTVVVTQVA